MAQAPDLLAINSDEMVTIRRRRSRNTYVIAAVLASAIAMLAILLLWRQHYATTHAQTENATIESNVYNVGAVIPGIVTEVLVHENEHVSKGQVLARLDNRELQLQEKQAETALQMARQQSEAARLQIQQIRVSAQARQDQIAESARRAQEALKAAQKDLQKIDQERARVAAAIKQAESAVQSIRKRLTTVFRGVRPEHHAMHQQQAAQHQQLAAQLKILDDKKAQLQQIIPQLKAAIAAGSTREDRVTPQQLAVARQNFAATQTAVKQAQLALEQIRLAAGYSSVTSPVDGVVAKIALQPGQRLHPGQPVVAIVEPGTWVTANFEQNYVGQIRPGQVAEIRLPSSDRVIYGRVQSVAPIAMAQPVTPPFSAAPKPLAKPAEGGQAAKSAANSRTIKQAAAVVEDRNPARDARADAPQADGIEQAPAASAQTHEGAEQGAEAAAAPEAAPQASSDAAIEAAVTGDKSPQTASQATPQTGANAKTPSQGPAGENAPAQPVKTVRRIPVKITFDPESVKGLENRIIPGMSATVSIRVR